MRSVEQKVIRVRKDVADLIIVPHQVWLDLRDGLLNVPSLDPTDVALQRIYGVPTQTYHNREHRTTLLMEALSEGKKVLMYNDDSRRVCLFKPPGGFDADQQ